MNDDRLPKMVLSGHPSRAKRKAVAPIGWEDILGKDLKKRNFVEGFKEGSFKLIGMEKERAQLCWPQVT